MNTIVIVNINTGERIAEVAMEEAPAYFRTHRLTIVGVLPDGAFLVEVP